MSTPKLSEQQAQLLSNCSVMPQNIVTYYPSAKALVRKGFCERKSNGHRLQLAITEAGRKHLEDSK